MGERARGVPGEAGAGLHVVHASGWGARTTRAWHIGNHWIFTSFWGCYRTSLRSVFTYLSLTLSGRTPWRARAVRPRGRGPARRPPGDRAALRTRATVSRTTRSRTPRRSVDSAWWTTSRRPPVCARSSSGRRRTSDPRRRGLRRRAVAGRATTWGGEAAGSAETRAGRGAAGCSLRERFRRA